MMRGNLSSSSLPVKSRLSQLIDLVYIKNIKEIKIMKRNMKEWMKNALESERKKPIPILGFPIASKMGLTVTELLADPETQAKGMELLSKEVDCWAALTYMDLSVEAEAFGCEVDFADDEVPNVLNAVVKTRADAEALAVPEVGAGRTQIYIDGCAKAVDLVTEKPLLAGCIGPFSLAGRIMDIGELIMNCKKDPETVHILLEKCTEFIIKYVKAYKAAGANGVAMAEPLAGLMKPSMLKEFSSDYVKRIVDEVQDDFFCVVYHNCGNSTIKSVNEIVYCGASAYHFGNAIDMGKMMELMPENIIAMGNVDPAVELCNGTPESVRQATLEVMEKCCSHKNFIISSGCDIPAHSPWENLYAFFDAVEEYYNEN